jgi:hypothetical protein
MNSNAVESHLIALDIVACEAPGAAFLVFCAEAGFGDLALRA